MSVKGLTDILVRLSQSYLRSVLTWHFVKNIASNGRYDVLETLFAFIDKEKMS